MNIGLGQLLFVIFILFLLFGDINNVLSNLKALFQKSKQILNNK